MPRQPIRCRNEVRHTICARCKDESERGRDNGNARAVPGRISRLCRRSASATTEMTSVARCHSCLSAILQKTLCVLPALFGPWPGIRKRHVVQCVDRGERGQMLGRGPHTTAPVRQRILNAQGEGIRNAIFFSVVLIFHKSRCSISRFRKV